MQIRVAHSPDPDDRAMFWALAQGYVSSSDFQFEFFEASTSELNELASSDVVPFPDVCAISAAHYPEVSSRYSLLEMGASIGDGYGPVLVTKEVLPSQAHLSPLDTLMNNGRQPFLLTPGVQTTAHKVLLSLTPKDVFAGYQECSIVPMEHIFNQLKSCLTTISQDQYPVALLIHEGRLVYSDWGCSLVLDLGKEWERKMGSPLVLGINVISKKLDVKLRKEVADILKRSCSYFLENRGRFISWYLQKYQSPLSAEALDRYLHMYCNAETLCLSASAKDSFFKMLQVVSNPPVNPAFHEWY